jgi:hypothetical protein
MIDWMAIAQWDQCHALARPSIVFQIQNVEGQSMLTPCVKAVPPAPFDWKTPPVRFEQLSSRARNVRRPSRRPTAASIRFHSFRQR